MNKVFENFLGAKYCYPKDGEGIEDPQEAENELKERETDETDGQELNH
jgi:hypothetical protein